MRKTTVTLFALLILVIILSVIQVTMLQKEIQELEGIIEVQQMESISLRDQIWTMSQQLMKEGSE